MNHSSNSDESELPDIPGLNTKEGLSRVAGNVKLYRKILKQFAENQVNAAEEIASQIHAGDLETAKRTAHTVKGVAGNLGAAALHKLAGDVENAIGKEDLSHKLESLRADLGVKLVEFVERLRPILGASKNGGSKKRSTEVDTNRWPDVRGELEQLLNDGDASATDVLEKERDLVAAILGEDKASELIDHVESFSFEDALDLLKS